MTAEFDKTRDYVTCGGRLPLRYIQGGYGFDNGFNLIGRVDADGNIIHGDTDQPNSAVKKRGRQPKEITLSGDE